MALASAGLSLGLGLGERGTTGLLAAARLEVGVLGHHHLAAEDADQRAVLVVALGLDVHDAAVVLGRALPLVEHLGLAVDRVAVEGRRDVAQRLDLEVGDRLAADVRHGHAQQQRVDVVADDDVLLELLVAAPELHALLLLLTVHGSPAMLPDRPADGTGPRGVRLLTCCGRATPAVSWPGEPAPAVPAPRPGPA